MTSLPHLGCYTIPSEVMKVTERFLQERGRRGSEGLVLWAGREVSHRRLAITRYLIPQQEASALHFDVPEEEMKRILSELTKAGERLLVQIHSHPRDAFMSEADIRSPVVSHRGALSIVVPNYRSLQFRTLADAKVFIYRAYGDWPELDSTDLSTYFMIEEARNV